MTMPDIKKAAQLLHAGGLVAFPTETVYGLGADASNPEAIAKIFRAKERPHDHPLIVHLAHFEQIHDWAREVSDAARMLAQTYWPGPLTLILKKQAHVLDAVTGGQDTVGLRLPRHPLAQALLQAFGGGVVGPSANKFTHISPTSAYAVQQELGGAVDMILDGGACEVGLESTILDMSGEVPVLLRPGMLSVKAIEARLGMRIIYSRQDSPRAPGMHHLHYAPSTKTSLIATEAIPTFLQTATLQQGPLALLAYTPLSGPLPAILKLIKMPQDAAHYAHDLYDKLREADHLSCQGIFIEAVPAGEEWDAIRDRLTRASGSSTLR
jgi:L-threonylcarbamoyladenylate synthase